MFFNRYKFSNYGKNKFISLLQKGVYHYEYIGVWEKFNGTSLPEKEHLQSLKSRKYYLCRLQA